MNLKDNIVAYRDFIIFEERLKYSLKLFKFRQRQYYAMLFALSFLIGYFLWLINFSNLKDPFWISTNKFMLFILLSVFLLLLSSENIWQSKRFVSRINRVLANYKIQFHKKEKELKVLSTNHDLKLSKEQITFRNRFQLGLDKFRTAYQKKAGVSSTTKPKAKT
ncbi:hypothetical protein K502DRAFT_324155 [Neoconidiobolus thromboides FSU 785]|nr:hypothetical protein K502DRAFT_324155 [Neoconidiobolus thromboides FSU 785]